MLLGYGVLPSIPKYSNEIMRKKEVSAMFQKKYYLYLSQSDFRVLLQSLVHMRNRLIREGRFTDCVDELIQKVISAPAKKVSYISQPPAYLQVGVSCFQYIAVCFTAGG